MDECIARIPLVDNGAEPDEGAITLQEKTWLLSRWLSERNRLRQMGSDCAFKYGSGINTLMRLICLGNDAKLCSLDVCMADCMLMQVPNDWSHQSALWGAGACNSVFPHDI